MAELIGFDPASFLIGSGVGCVCATIVCVIVFGWLLAGRSDDEGR